MSSEALAHARRMLEAEPFAVRRYARTQLLDGMHALLAEVARLERERDEALTIGRSLHDDEINSSLAATAAEEALAVAREREQRADDALAFYADENNWTQSTSWGGRIHDDESAAIRDGGKRARAALVDEPAAASDAVSRPNEWTASNVPEFEYREAPAAATLAEPEARTRGGEEVPHERAASSVCGPQDASGSASAAADEPGETP